MKKAFVALLIVSSTLTVSYAGLFGNTVSSKGTNEPHDIYTIKILKLKSIKIKDDKPDKTNSAFGSFVGDKVGGSGGDLAGDVATEGLSMNEGVRILYVGSDKKKHELDEIGEIKNFKLGDADMIVTHTSNGDVLRVDANK